MTRIFLCSFLLAGIFAFTFAEKKTKIFLAGDSTISIKESRVFPETGWGMPFTYFWDSSITVVNRAKNGRSTKTFIAEGLWQSIADEMSEGDYLFIQFGHNDEAKEKTDRYTTPEEYKANINRFISEARAKKVTPVLLTPVSRRKFKDGKAIETHVEYSALLAEVAKATGVAFIDLDTKSRELYQKMGEEYSKLLFLQLAPGEHPNYPEGKVDNTHFSELGARLIAQIVLSEMKALDLPITRNIIVPKKK